MKNFLIYSASYFGDTLVTDSLLINLKRIYPNCHIVYIVNKPFSDVAKYMHCVDEVWAFDKHGEHKGIKGNIKFIKKYKNIYKFDAAFLTFSAFRGAVIAKMLDIKNIYSERAFFAHKLFLNQNTFKFKNHIHVQDRIAYLAELYSKQPMNIEKIKYNIPQSAMLYVDDLLKNIKKPFILINPLTKNTVKDLKKEIVCNLVQKITNAKYQAILTGLGKEIDEYYNSLSEETRKNLLNFGNKTTIPQLAALLKRAELLISADTGTAHFALSTDTPLIDIFYRNDKEALARWMPKSIYKAINITHEKSFDFEYIWEQSKKLLQKENL